MANKKRGGVAGVPIWVILIGVGVVIIVLAVIYGQYLGARAIVLQGPDQNVVIERPLVRHQTSLNHCYDNGSRYCERKAEVKRIIFHDIRHTIASHLVMNRVSIYEVKTFLGHANIASTEQYAHLAPDYLRSAIDAVDYGECVSESTIDSAA